MRFVIPILLVACLILPSALTKGYGSVSQAQAPAPGNWGKVDLRHFSFHLPLEMKPTHGRGIDSAIWRYASDDIKLTIDFGLYSGKPSVYEEEPEYLEKRIKIDGRRATLCFFRFAEPALREYRYAAAVYFSGIGSKETKLSFFAMCKTPKEQVIAEAIFRTIKFRASKRR